MSYNYRFCDRPTYFRQLAEEISRTRRGDRIGLATMVFDQREPLVSGLAGELTAAAKRGVTVYFVVDAHSFLLADKPRRLGPLWFGRPLSSKAHNIFGERFDWLERLNRAGGQAAVINQPSHRFSLPVAGRSHIKAAVVNDRVYIGGHNLSDVNQIDLMTYWDNRVAADIVFKFLQQVASAGSIGQVLSHDTSFKLDDRSTLIIDAGQRRTSLILDEAVALIDRSKDWLYMTCQYFPGGRTGRSLQAALKRGVKVRLIFSPPSTHGSDRFGHKLYELSQRLRLPAELFANRLPDGVPKLHAKIIATEQGAIMGSHNYVGQGVFLGTAEIALLRRDPDFAKAAVQAVQNELKSYL